MRALIVHSVNTLNIAKHVSV